MSKVIEQLRKDARPINPKCLGQELGTLEAMLDKKHPICTRIEEMPVFEIIDEETGAIDEEAAPTFTNTDPACRCTAYAYPNAKWKVGKCPLATHILAEGEVVEKVRVGQQKQKKKR